MNAEIKAKIKEYAVKESPNEACGFVVVNSLGVVSVIPCENKAHNKRGRFVIDPAMNLVADSAGHVAAFYHSHASEFLDENDSRFSKEDLDISYESGLPALLYAHPNDTWTYSRPDTYEPYDLLGRPFVWGIWDCYSLVKDYYKIHRRKKLTDYFPPDLATTKSDFGYERYILNENFHEVPLKNAQKDDILIFQIKSEYYNHSAVYLGNNEYLHHPINRISSKGILDDRIMKYVVKTLRCND